MRCTKCHRNLTRPPILVAGQALGPVCAREMGYRLQVRVRVPRRGPVDARQGELQLEVPA